MKIRKARRNDLDAFIKLYTLSYRGLEEYAYTSRGEIKRYFHWLLSRDPEGFFVAEMNEPIGFIACDTNWFSHFEGEILGEIHELFVHPEHRGHGIGRALINKAIKYAKSRGRRTIGLWVGLKNFHAKKFYKRMGFIESISLGKWTRMVKKI